MNEIQHVISWAVWFALLPLAILHLRDYRRLTRHIEKNDPDLWEKLGEPDLFNTSPRNILKMLRFLQHSSDYEDAYVRSLATTIKTRMWIFVIIFSIANSGPSRTVVPE